MLLFGICWILQYLDRTDMAGSLLLSIVFLAAPMTASHARCLPDRVNGLLDNSDKLDLSPDLLLLQPDRAVRDLENLGIERNIGAGFRSAMNSGSRSRRVEPRAPVPPSSVDVSVASSSRKMRMAGRAWAGGRCAGALAASISKPRSTIALMPARPSVPEC